MSNDAGALIGGLIGVVVVAVVLVVLGTSIFGLLPLLVAGGFLAWLLVRALRA